MQKTCPTCKLTWRKSESCPWCPQLKQREAVAGKKRTREEFDAAAAGQDGDRKACRTCEKEYPASVMGKGQCNQCKGEAEARRKLGIVLGEKLGKRCWGCGLRCDWAEDAWRFKRGDPFVCWDCNVPGLTTARAKEVEGFEGKVRTLQGTENPSWRVCLRLCKTDGNAFVHVPAYLQTAEMCEAAVKGGLQLHKLAAPGFNVCKAAVERKGAAIERVPAEFRGALWEAAAKTYGRAIQYAPEQTAEACRAAVAKSGMALGLVEERFRGAVWQTALEQNGEALKWVPAAAQTGDVRLAAVQNNGLALRHVPAPLRTRELCLAAVEQNGAALNWVPEAAKTRKLCLAAVRSNGLALEHVPAPLRTRELCLAAVEQTGLALEWVGGMHDWVVATALNETWQAVQFVRAGAEFVVAVVERNWRALGFVQKERRTEAMCKAAVEQHWEALRWVPGELQNEAMCNVAVGQSWKALRHVEEPSEELCGRAIGQSWEALEWSKKTGALCVRAVTKSGAACAWVPERLSVEVFGQVRSAETAAACIAVKPALLRLVGQHMRDDVLRALARSCPWWTVRAILAATDNKRVQAMLAPSAREV